DRLRPVLDAAMLELNEADREAVLLRFFGGRSFAEVGAALRMPEDTARKRVERALDKLHGLLARRGIASSATALAVVLSENAVAAAPVGLGTAVSATVLSGNAAAVATGGALLAFSMSKLSFGVAAAVLLGLLAVNLGQRRSEIYLRAEIAQLQRERESVRTAAVSEERRATVLRATLAAEIAREVTEPEIPLTPLTEIQLASLDESYAALFRRLRLSEEKLDTLRQLLIERQKGEAAARKFARDQGLSLDEMDFPMLKELFGVWNSTVDARVRRLLGESDFAYYEFFLRTSHHRSRFGNVVDLLERIAAPLRDEQIDQLVVWMEESTPRHVRPFENGPYIPDEVMRRAPAILSPVQMEKLTIVRDHGDAMVQIHAMNRIAAQRGVLVLSRQSAAFDPSRTAKPVTNP
ncbi:MAG: sigma factor-like helix-turn-helix DNA-binding protein, partial [Opitutaceae bacterium]